jgi:hypothetical protein
VYPDKRQASFMTNTKTFLAQLKDGKNHSIFITVTPGKAQDVGQ